MPQEHTPVGLDRGPVLAPLRFVPAVMSLSWPWWPQGTGLGYARPGVRPGGSEAGGGGNQVRL